MPARVSNLAGCSGRFPQLADGGGVTTRGSEAMTALVMEQVEGEDLSAVIARGPIPFADALPIAKRIAEALEAAHGHWSALPRNVRRHLLSDAMNLV